MKIIINNRDLNDIQIDMYQCFNMEMEIEREIEYASEEAGEELSYDDFEWEYDMEGYREALSKASIEFILNRLDDDSVIKKIEYISSNSPKFYNYTTDSYNAEYEYNIDALWDYILKNMEGYKSYMRENWKDINLNRIDWKKRLIEKSDYKIENGDMKIFDKEVRIEEDEDIITSMIAYYLSEELGDISEEYIWDLMENAYASEYIDMKRIEKNEEEGL